MSKPGRYRLQGPLGSRRLGPVDVDMIHCRRMAVDDPRKPSVRPLLREHVALMVAHAGNIPVIALYGTVRYRRHHVRDLNNARTSALRPRVGRCDPLVGPFRSGDVASSWIRPFIIGR